MLGMIDKIKMKFPVPDDVVAIKDVVYMKDDSVDLHLDIYYPKNIKKNNRFFCLFIGEAYLMVISDYLSYTCNFAQKGYVTASV